LLFFLLRSYRAIVFRRERVSSTRAPRPQDRRTASGRASDGPCAADRGPTRSCRSVVKHTRAHLYPSFDQERDAPRSTDLWPPSVLVCTRRGHRDRSITPQARSPSSPPAIGGRSSSGL
jgi:hypothetical protein